MKYRIGQIIIAKKAEFRCLTKGCKYKIKDIDGDDIIFNCDLNPGHTVRLCDVEKQFTIQPLKINTRIRIL